METNLLKMYESIVNGIVPTPLNWVEIEVELTTKNPVFQRFIHSSYRSMRQSVELSGGDFSLEQDVWTEYVKFCVKQRVQYVRKERVDFGPTDRLLMPHFLSTLLQNVGLAEEVDLGIQIVPKYTEEVNISLDQVRDVVLFLKTMSTRGFTFAEQYSRDRRGDWNLMAMTVVNDQVASRDKAPHPVYAVLASMLLYDATIAKVITPRVTYGSVQLMTTFVDEMVGARI